MEIFEASKSFPKQETYSLTDQIRRSSRSVTTNIAEAWRKRRYEPAFVSKLNDAEAEAAETQDWLHYSVACGYLDRDQAAGLYQAYEDILKTLVGMITHADTWVFPTSPKTARDAKAQHRTM
jgi:four helix bundle protein